MQKSRKYAETRDAELADLRKRIRRPGREQQNSREFGRLLGKYGEDPVALRGLATTVSEAGMLDQGLRLLQEAVKALGPHAELMCGLADLLIESGRTGDALNALLEATRSNPDAVEPRLAMGRILLNSGRYAVATEQYRAALAAKPRDRQAELGLALSLQNWGRYHLAIPHFEAVLAARPGSLNAAIGLGICRQRIGDFDGAVAACRKALAVEPELTVAIAAEAAALTAAGRSEEALAKLKPCLAGEPPPPIVTILARNAVALNAVSLAIEACERATASPANTPEVRESLQWAFGAVLESAGEFDRAFAAYGRGYSQAELPGKKVESFRAFVDASVSVFSGDATQKLARATTTSELPVFVVGTPGSGTRVVERILAAHPAIFVAGALPDIPDLTPELAVRANSGSNYPACLPAVTSEVLDEIAARQRRCLAEFDPNAQRVVDSNPLNLRFLGLLWMLFPGVRVIHVRREPLDACFSWFAEPAAAPILADLSQVGPMYRECERLMAHWKSALDLPILEMQYEALVTDPAGAARQMLEFCGLPWEDACTRPHESTRLALLSEQDQARRPIDASGVGRAARFAAHLGPLRAALGQ